MGKTQDTNDTLVLEYDLYDLPTAQHKAGLAGLLLMIESMHMRQMSPLPEVVECEASRAKFLFTIESVQAVLKDLYKGKKILTKKGNEKYIPALEYLAGFGIDETWIKAWQDCVSSVIRKGAAHAVYSKPHDGRKEFSDLQAGQNRSVPILGSLMLAGEGKNAERVIMKGARKHNFLLHFTLLPTLLFVPRFLVKDSKTMQWCLSDRISKKRSGPFFVLVIPEPLHLKSFVEDVKQLLRSLDPQVQGYRPRAAVIDVPEEGGLEYLYHLVRSKVTQQEIKYNLAAVEIYHLEKRGNNIRSLSAGRLAPDPGRLETYEKLRTQCRNPLYRSQRLRNLLADMPWHAGMQSVFNQYPWEFFVWNEEKTPRLVSCFGKDVRKKFRAIEDETKEREGGDLMSEETRDDELANRVYKLIQVYVNSKTEEKSGKKYEDFKNDKDAQDRIKYPKEYREAREKVCRDAFLGMRGRHEKDFVEYFTSTVCSVPQQLPEKDFLVVSKALLTKWEDVKTLSMLALSAWSYFSKAQ